MTNDRVSCSRDTLSVRPRDLLCTVCYVAGCNAPPAGIRCVRRLLAHMQAGAWNMIRLTADIELGRVPYSAAYGAKHQQAVPADFERRQDDYVRRFGDLNVLRLLGLQSGDTRPAYELAQLLFKNITSLDGICRFPDVGESTEWPVCPHARHRFYETVRGTDIFINQGISIAGTERNPLYALLTPRTDTDRTKAKKQSVALIRKADRLCIRPAHLMCLVCLYGRGNSSPLPEDNLYELRRRIQACPEIPITLSEGCCMACAPCPVYDAAKHLCYHAHTRSQLRDLMVLRKLGLRPGATLPARILYTMLYDRIQAAHEICGWGDGLETTAEWKACGDLSLGYYERARSERFLAGTPDCDTHERTTP